MEIIYGKNPVMEVLRSKRVVHKLLLADHLKGSIVAEIEMLAAGKGVRMERDGQQQLSSIARGGKHQGIVAFVEPFAYWTVNDILRSAERRKEPSFLVVLDRVEDPHNLGAIIRSGEAAGIHGVIIPKDHAVRVTPIVEKAAAGASAFIPIALVTNLVRTMQELKEEGLWFYGACQDGDIALADADFSAPAGIVLGGEGSGMRRLVREQCDFTVRIPMFGRINSLNVSVAAGIFFFAVRAQRPGAGEAEDG